MKWTDKQVKKLRELCEKDTPNAEIAATLKVQISDVYAKRSQLGITIDKIKAAQAQAPAENIDNVPTLDEAIKKAFKDLHDAHDSFLAAIASDQTSKKDTQILTTIVALITDTENLYNALTQKS